MTNRLGTTRAYGIRPGVQCLLGAGIVLLFSTQSYAQTCYWWYPNGGGSVQYSTPAQACAALDYGYNSPNAGFGGLNYSFVYSLGTLFSGSVSAGTAHYYCNETETVSGDPRACTNGGSYCGTWYHTDRNNVIEGSGCNNSFYLLATAPALAQTCSTNCVSDPINPARGNVYFSAPDVKVGAATSYGRFYNSADASGSNGVPGWRQAYTRSVNAVYATPGVPYPGQSFTASPEYANPADACTIGFATIQGAVSAWSGATANYINGTCVLSRSGATIGTLPVSSLYMEEYPTPLEYDVIRDDGRTIRYTLQNGVINNPPGVSTKFSITSSGYAVVDDEDNVETYNNSGVLQTIRSRAGIVQTLSYNGSGQLSSVSDSFGHRITLTYSAQGQLTQVSQK